MTQGPPWSGSVGSEVSRETDEPATGAVSRETSEPDTPPGAEPASTEATWAPRAWPTQVVADAAPSREVITEAPLAAAAGWAPTPVEEEATVGTGPTGLGGPPVSRETEHDTPIAREAAQAVHVLNVRQEEWPRPPKTRVLTVANQKGGVGKTTSAVNIAAALALHGVRVLLIDLDPQGNASTALGIEHGVGTPSVYDALLGGRPLAEVSQTTDFAPNLRCIPATLDLAGADIELTSQVAREYRLQRALQAFLETEGSGVDYVLIDCPPSLGLLTLNALVAAKEMLIPIQCEYYALEGLAQLLKTVELVTSHLNQDLTVTTVLLTMYDSRTRLADQVADEVRRHFGDLVLAPTIPRNVRVSEAPGFGQTVITYDPGSRGAIGYLQAAREIAERGAATSSSETAGQGEA
jgi:chromosome partitioning protein